MQRGDHPEGHQHGEPRAGPALGMGAHRPRDDRGGDMMVSLHAADRSYLRGLAAQVRDIEWTLLKSIYHWENIKDDEVITDRIYIPLHYRFTDWWEGRQRPY